MCESWLFDTRLSQRIGRSRLGYDGSASRTFNAPVLTTAFNSAKISLLVFYIDILENKSKICECSIVTSEAVVKHVIIYL